LEIIRVEDEDRVTYDTNTDTVTVTGDISAYWIDEEASYFPRTSTRNKVGRSYCV
jgi:hypothetical protein